MLKTSQFLDSLELRSSLTSKAVIPDEIEHIATLDDENSPSIESMERIEDLRREDSRADPVTWRATHVITVPQPSGPEEAIPIVNSNVDEYVPVPVWSHEDTLPQRAARAGGTIWRRVTNFMTPPLWASVASLVVALYQPLQHFIRSYLRPFRGAITQAGDCSIPLTLVVLGAYFHRPPDKSKLPPSDDLESQRATPLRQLRKIFCLESENRMGAIWLTHQHIPARKHRRRADDLHNNTCPYVYRPPVAPSTRGARRSSRFSGRVQGVRPGC